MIVADIKSDSKLWPLGINMFILVFHMGPYLWYLKSEATQGTHSLQCDRSLLSLGPQLKNILPRGLLAMRQAGVIQGTYSV